jgi:hypothetical protein
LERIVPSLEQNLGPLAIAATLCLLIPPKINPRYSGTRGVLLTPESYTLSVLALPLKTTLGTQRGHLSTKCFWAAISPAQPCVDEIDKRQEFVENYQDNASANLRTRTSAFFFLRPFQAKAEAIAVIPAPAIDYELLGWVPRRLTGL